MPNSARGFGQSTWFAATECVSSPSFISSRGTPHIYQDGFVERSFSIVIRDRRAFAEYSIGLNDLTAKQILAEAQAKQKRASAPQPQADKAASTKPHSAGKPRLSPPHVPVGKEASTPSSGSISTASPAPPSGSPSNPRTAAEGEHLTDPQLISTLATMEKFWFRDQLEIKCDGQRVTLGKLEVSGNARHPYSLVVRFEFDLPPIDLPLKPDQSLPKNQPQQSSRPAKSTNPTPEKSGIPRTIRLQVFDRTFDQQQGAVRLALKARGRTMIGRSNVAAILVRSERIELEGLSAQQRQEATSIDAKLIVSPN